MKKTTINIVHLYASEMNIYGDTGNRLIIEYRFAERGYKTNIHFVGVGEELPSDTHILLGGGGQDKGQEIVSADLMQKRTSLESIRDAGVPMLLICGMYQLFGDYFRTSEGTEVPGIGLIDAHTIASGDRLVGNVVASSDFGELVGYENHSGRTYLGGRASPLGIIKKGGGNNGHDASEGARQVNIVATYLHGPILAKSPKLADWLIQKALQAAGCDENVELEPLAVIDSFARKAAQSAKLRPK